MKMKCKLKIFPVLQVTIYLRNLYFLLLPIFFFLLFKDDVLWFKIARISYSCSLSLAFLLPHSSLPVTGTYLILYHIPIPILYSWSDKSSVLNMY